MNIFEQYLSEIAGGNVPFNITKREPHMFRTEADLAAGHMVFVALEEDDDMWHVVFGLQKPGRGSLQFDATNSNIGVGETLSFVRGSMEKFFTMYKPSYVTFSAKKEGRNSARANVYEKLVKRYATSYGFKMEKITRDGETEFALTKG